jgi:SAM-dependent methyltransferase
MRLNLGCGQDYREGWVNLDCAAVRCDVRADLRNGLPFSTREFYAVYASGVLEQIGPNEQFVLALNECHRVLRNGGELTAIVPNAAHPIAFRDPFDCRQFTEESWQYFDLRSRFWQTYGQGYGFRPWMVRSVSTNGAGIMTAVMEKA